MSVHGRLKSGGTLRAREQWRTCSHEHMMVKKDAQGRTTPVERCGGMRAAVVSLQTMRSVQTTGAAGTTTTA